MVVSAVPAFLPHRDSCARVRTHTHTFHRPSGSVCPRPGPVPRLCLWPQVAASRLWLLRCLFLQRDSAARFIRQTQLYVYKSLCSLSMKRLPLAHDADRPHVASLVCVSKWAGGCQRGYVHPLFLGRLADGLGSSYWKRVLFGRGLREAGAAHLAQGWDPHLSPCPRP